MDLDSRYARERRKDRRPCLAQSGCPLDQRKTVLLASVIPRTTVIETWSARSRPTQETDQIALLGCGS